jgi:hypothetical protein
MSFVVIVKSSELLERRTIPAVSVDRPYLLTFLIQRHFLAVEKHAMPQFQGDQRKDLFGVGTGIAVGTNKLFNGGLLKVS